jgi:hypothetical protein
LGKEAQQPLSRNTQWLPAMFPMNTKGLLGEKDGAPENSFNIR